MKNQKPSLSFVTNTIKLLNIIMFTRHRIIIGDSRKMEEVPDKSVNLIITSPPYWQLKDYGVENQIGFNDSYEDYINNLNFGERMGFKYLDLFFL